MGEHDTRRILIRKFSTTGVCFSSSCATFGSPTEFPITESTPQRPTNPYGQAKLQAEQAIVAFLRSRERQHVPFSAAMLRYFNVVGADPKGRMGPHLRHKANARFPRILDAVYDVGMAQDATLRQSYVLRTKLARAAARHRTQ